MGMWSAANNKPSSRAERISEGLANFGRERMLRENQASNDYADGVRGMRSAPGGQTSRPQKPERLSLKDKIAAEAILHKGRQPRGKK